MDMRMQADIGNPANVVVKRTLALTLHGNLLMKGLVNIIKAWNRLKRFLNDRRLIPFFS